MKENTLASIKACGQSVWVDVLSRNLIRSGELKRLIEQDGVSGVTSNPAIFEKAIGGSDDYDEEIGQLAVENRSPSQIYEWLAVADIQSAADLLRAVHERSKGLDGFVSLEVSPLLAYDTNGTVLEARRLWSALDRPNVMIKIPATREGLPAIAQCISEGININVTLLFGLSRYREVTDAYLQGLEERLTRGDDLHHIRSVASFFLSRIDVSIDPILEQSERGLGLRGQVAIASAKLAYQIYREVFSSDRWQKLYARGANKQWLLWGSTSTKTESYSDVKYVEPLIGPETVNTMPLETLRAFRDHGKAALSLEDGVTKAVGVMNGLTELGIDIDKITQKLEDEGVKKFVEPYKKLMRTLEQKTRSVQTF